MDKKQLIYSVLVGILVTLLVSHCIEPLSVFVWRFIASASNDWFTHLQNESVRLAALGKRDWVPAKLFLEFIGFLFAGAIASVTYPLIPQRLHKITDQLILGDMSTADKINRDLKFYQRFKRIVFCFGIILLILGITQTRTAFLVYVDIQMNASFGQRIDALAPYLDEQTVKQFRSRWALMKTLPDYRQLTGDMDALGKKAGIDLPVPLYK